MTDERGIRSARSLIGDVTVSVTIDNLPQRTSGEFLYCWKCGDHYSATRGDYFWMLPGARFECDGQPGARHRAVRLQLARRVSFLVPA